MVMMKIIYNFIIEVDARGCGMVIINNFIILSKS